MKKFDKSDFQLRVCIQPLSKIDAYQEVHLQMHSSVSWVATVELVTLHRHSHARHILLFVHTIQ